MKKRIVFPVLLILTAVIFLASCTPAANNIKRVKSFPVYGNYRLIGSGAATHGRDQVFLSDIISSAIKKSGRKINKESDYATLGHYYGDYYFFISQYYQEKTDDLAPNNYYYYKTLCAFGYIDLVTLEADVYCSFEILKAGASDGFGGISFINAGSTVACIVDGESIELVNAETLEYRHLLLQDKYAVEQDYEVYGITEEWVVYRENVGGYTDNHYAVSFATAERADDDTLERVLNELYEEESKTLPYGGKQYVYSLTDDKITLTESGADAVYEISVENMREKSEEFRKVEEMGEVELSFCGVIAQNGEIYISARYYDIGGFGMRFFSKATAVLCYLYEPETAEVKYIGWLRGNSYLSAVIKL